MHGLHRDSDDAHKICPYSRATRGNVPVTLTVV
jgi:organic hydroperoxide reductase OsmC/OhrA